MATITIFYNQSILKQLITFFDKTEITRGWLSRDKRA